MKKIIFSTIILVLAITSCKKNEPVVTINPITISASKTLLSFNTLQNNAFIKITMTGDNWNATSDQSWCTLSKPFVLPAVATATVH
jgi:putative lipase involved disintegration of autophagic bodies